MGDKKPEQHEGLVFYYTHYVDEDNVGNYTIRMVDDQNLPQSSLGLRRLAIKSSKDTLFPICIAIYFLADLIKLAKATTWFIDSNGKVFQWKKYARAKLVTRKIKQILPADGIGCVLEVEGLSQRFKSLQRPEDFHQYAVFLVINQMYILYGLSEITRKDSWRLV